MTPELEWKLELEKIREENQRWHKEYDQRKEHWVRMQIFWTISGLAAAALAGAAIVKLLGA